MFVSLHEASIPLIEREGFPALNFFDHVRPLHRYPINRAVEIAEGFGIGNISRAISHEQWFYGIRDRAHLTAKLAAYLEAMDGALASITHEHPAPVLVVQELGGFLSVLAALHAARRRALDTIFIEPSFFRGRVFFTKNSLNAPNVTAASRPPTIEMQHYVQETLRHRRIVIPAKDARFYRSAAGKIFNRRNVWRLIEKNVQKYLRSQREEFSNIASYSLRHVRMLINYWRLRPHYSELPTTPFIYYPLHVPADVALTLRAPEYLDQFGLLDLLVRNLPTTHLLAIKEHPALMGAFSPSRILELMKRYDNLVVLRPSINNLDVIERAAAVVTVNSKSGAEALLLHRPVVVLGDAFYRGSGLVRVCSSPAALEDELLAAVRQVPHSQDVIEQYFQNVWDSCYPGELYDADDQNCETFAASLETMLAVETGHRPVPTSPR